MKLTDRERVDGTEVTIGHRVHYENHGKIISKTYSAEFRDADGKQVSESLGTTNRARARRLAIEIQNRLDTGTGRPVESQTQISELCDRYFDSVKAKGVAPKTIYKYDADLKKLKKFCEEKDITLARRFGEQDFFRFRRWLVEQEYAAKTVEAALILTKQVFKWAWRQHILRDYSLASASLGKAKAGPQPCFTTDQVDTLIEAGQGEEKAAFALMGYAGLRIGEVEQLHWEDLREKDGKLTMLHIRRGGSMGTTKDKDERFVPIHPRVAPLLQPRKKSGVIFSTFRERTLLQRLKDLCKEKGFEKPDQYKLHSLRHHFASLCANHGVAYRKALAWLGHSSSDMLNLYYHLYDEDSQQSMVALAASHAPAKPQSSEPPPSEGSLRAVDQSTIEKTPQAPEIQELVACLTEGTEREGFEPPEPRRAQRISNPPLSTTQPPLLNASI